jgi:hypothetical protein
MLQYIRDKYDKGEKPVGCSGCGRHSTVSSRSVQSVSSIQQTTGAIIADESIVMVRLNSGNVGEVPIVGYVTKTFYGLRAHGDTFLMKKEDQVVKPHYYEVFTVDLPKEEPVVLPPPTPIVIIEDVLPAPVLIIEELSSADLPEEGDFIPEVVDEIIETSVDVIETKPVRRRKKKRKQ